MSEKLLLIDGHSILNRAFYGVPDLTNSAGMHTDAVYGFLNIMLKILDEECFSDCSSLSKITLPSFWVYTIYLLYFLDSSKV